jgi:hypothetical protein
VRLKSLTFGLAQIGCAALILVLAEFRAGAFLTKAVAGVVGAVLVLLLSQRIVGALVALIFLIPLQGVLLAYVLRLGAPVTLVRDLGTYKDVVIAAAIVAAFERHTTRRRADAIDKWAAAYVLVATLYLVLPWISSLHLYPASFYVRFLAWRLNVEFVVLLIVVRRLALTTRERALLEGAALWGSFVVAAAGIFEYLDSKAFNNFLVHTVRYIDYQKTLTGTTQSHGGEDLRGFIDVAGHNVLRIGSVLIDPVVLGFFLIPGLAISLRRLTARRTGASQLTLAVIGSALVLTLTRSAVLAAVVLIAVTILALPNVSTPGRTRLIILLVGVTGAAVPFAAHVHFTARSESAVAGTDVSTTGHIADLGHALAVLFTHPLGQGLGTVAGVGKRFKVAGRVTTENAYVQVGDEIGIFAAVALVGFLIALAIHLLRRQRGLADGSHAMIAGALVISFIVGGLLQEVWLAYATALTIAVLVGMACPVDDSDAAGDLNARGSPHDSEIADAGSLRRVPAV